MTHNRSPFALTLNTGRSYRSRFASLLIGLLAVGGSHANEKSMTATPLDTTADSVAPPSKAKEVRVWMTVGERRFAVNLADTEAARAFAARLPVTLDMTELNGNEKKFDLPKDLPTQPSRPGTIRSGDLMLYGANTVVLFYLTFDSPYSYTRLGQLEDPRDLARVLGKSTARIQFSMR